MTELAGPVIAPIGADALLVFLVQLAVLLAAARALGSIAGKLGMPSVVGELLAGVILGPSVFGKVLPSVSGWLFPAIPEQQHLIDAVGQVGVILLVGIAGMQLDPEQFRRRLGATMMISFFGLVIPLGLGIALGFVAPIPMRPADTPIFVFALFLGTALCVSAIPVIAKTLLELGIAHRKVGQFILAAGMFDDAVGWCLVSLVSALALHGSGPETLVIAVVGIGVLVVLALLPGRILTRKLVLGVAESGNTTRLLALIVVLIFGSAALSHSLGLEAIFGAFLCGMMLVSGGLRPHHIAPLNTVVMSVLAPIFFATAGLRMDLSVLVTGPLLLITAAVVVTAVVGKFAGAFLGGMLGGLSRRESFALGAGMNARGVIEVIIAMIGLRMGIIGVEAYTALITVAVVTSMMAPPLLRWAMSGIPEEDEEEERAQRYAAYEVKT
ncbi:cation:proton antiporter [Nocardia fluminea]|uniref:cation:proton antiporter n=1 Tax=Nocardia fluminea TaxID=134984 RepID=UPI003D0F120F